MSDDQKTLYRLREELAEWRGRIDHLRVQANLGRKEARDKLHELEERFGPAFRKAKKRLDEIVAGGTDEARSLGKSVLAGWEEARRAHRELSEAAEAERARSGEGRRS